MADVANPVFDSGSSPIAGSRGVYEVEETPNARRGNTSPKKTQQQQLMADVAAKDVEIRTAKAVWVSGRNGSAAATGGPTQL